MRLSWLPSTGVELQALPAEPASLPPGDAAVWEINVQLAADATQAQTVHFRVDYEYVPEGQKQPLQGASFAALEVELRPQPPTEQVAQIQAHSSIKTLDEYHPGLVYLTVSNLSGQSLQLGALEVKAPDFVQIEMMETLPSQLDAYASSTGAWKISAETATPGEHLLLFELPVTRQAEGQSETFFLQTSYPLRVSVFGESEILGALAAVPSFLILPGFLFLVMLRFVTNGWVKYKVTDEEFWLFAVSFSLLMALCIYPWTTQRLNQPRSYLGSYSFQDIVWVWFGSLILALLAAGVYWFVCWIQRLLEEQRTFSEKDTPSEVLGKLAKLGLGWRLLSARLKGKEGQGYVYLLEAVGSQKESYWVCSSMHYALEDVEDERLQIAQDQWSDALEVKETTLEQLRAILAQAQAGDLPPIRLTWNAQPVPGVRRVKSAELDLSLEAGLPAARAVIQKK